MQIIERFAPFALVVLFVGAWCLIGYVMSILTGWNRLAKRFPAPPGLKARLYRFRGAFFGDVFCSGPVTVGVSRQGLYMATFLLFRPFHKPLLIPWKEIRPERVKGSFLFNGYWLYIRSLPDVRIGLSRRLFDKILENLADQTEVRAAEPAEQAADQ